MRMHAGAAALLDEEWDDQPGWLPKQHYRAGALGDVYKTPDYRHCERLLPVSIPASIAEAGPPPSPPPRDPDLRLLSTGSGMTATEWKAWLGEWHT